MDDEHQRADYDDLGQLQGDVAMSEGVYFRQVRATVDGVTQTVAEAVVTVKGSL